MSLRWIHENLEAPTCDEECSDIDDSCSDDSYDSDLSIGEEKGAKNEKEINGDRRVKRETRRRTTTVKFDENGTPHFVTTASVKPAPCIIWDPRKLTENPVYNCLVIKLFCRTGYHLAVSNSGRVQGLSGTNEPHALFHIIPVSFGIIRMQSIETDLYVAFNKKGRLYGERNVNKDNTEWEQWNVGSYDAFRSRKYANHGWWIGIKKNGRAKPGQKTRWGQKAIQFLAIRQD
ncbi:fibroblast growth factor 1 [Megalopta genalis]|uniref:fibroblast growth factor 1 n=1 Tax=Megalopta genalis TaxID=115081 RepID=UPI00144313C4|nr:fibroblast growth factor 1-like [Megalopta genalis]XP_033326130.1 fibroblast growth factor 1-like [Megalopta genalis]XP_033326131.1 fibroblast growth factor 1-like [Megalopta genalis]XP_033326132.1 fibroblast growth factor 1-like [Megalopta genalis]XP_033326133.1 fibroblast growth factor 1-like [Megalopta genalis]